MTDINKTILESCWSYSVQSDIVTDFRVYIYVRHHVPWRRQGQSLFEHYSSPLRTFSERFEPVQYFGLRRMKAANFNIWNGDLGPRHRFDALSVPWSHHPYWPPIWNFTNRHESPVSKFIWKERRDLPVQKRNHFGNVSLLKEKPRSGTSFHWF